MAVKKIFARVLLAALLRLTTGQNLQLASTGAVLQEMRKNYDVEKMVTILSRKSAVVPPLITEVCSAEETLQQNGVYRFEVLPTHQFSSFCDMTTDSGQWLVFQRRLYGSENFDRTYKDYATGFGNRAGEFWLGLETLHQLTSRRNYSLRVDLGDWAGNYRYAKYSTFKVASAKDGYRLTVSGFSGTASNSLSFHNGAEFSTKYHDRDLSKRDCAARYKGGWWYKTCHYSNINSLYKKGSSPGGSGVRWRRGHYYSLKFTEMKIRVK